MNSPISGFSYFRNAVFISVATVFVLMGLVAGSAVKSASTSLDDLHASATPTPAAKKVFSSFRDVSIGMTAEETRKVLGEAKDSSDTEDFFVFSDKETMQIVYDANKKVDAISITFYGDLEKAPALKEVLGEIVPAKADGSIFKMVRYDKAGFWVSYSKTSGDSPTVSITLKKI
ncbi:MAG: hypothetical protein ACRD6X_15500 [Pyrinomonadaceae bacterium]